MAYTTEKTFSGSEMRMRWQEPYVTEGLNGKFYGVIPRGVYRGYDLEPGPSAQGLNIVADVTNSDHVAVYDDDDGYQLSLRITGGTFEIDLSAHAGLTVYIAIYANYVSLTTTSAELRAYPSADWAALTPAEQAEMILLGTVDVPASAVVIPSGDVDTSVRTMPLLKVPLQFDTSTEYLSDYVWYSPGVGSGDYVTHSKFDIQGYNYSYRDLVGYTDVARTLNAKFGTVWTADYTGSPAVYCAYVQSANFIGSYMDIKEITTGTWTSWDRRLWYGFQKGTGGNWLGSFRAQDDDTWAADEYLSPTSSLYNRNMVKAWARINVVGSSISYVGYNIASVSFVSTYLQVVLSTALNLASEVSAVVNSDNGSYIPNASISAANTIFIEVRDFTGAVVDISDPLTTAGLHLHVLGVS